MEFASHIKGSALRMNGINNNFEVKEMKKKYNIKSKIRSVPSTGMEQIYHCSYKSAHGNWSMIHFCDFNKKLTLT